MPFTVAAVVGALDVCGEAAVDAEGDFVSVEDGVGDGDAAGVGCDAALN